MNDKTALLTVLGLAGLLTGCQPIKSPVDSPALKNTNVVSNAGSLAAAVDYSYERKDEFVAKARADLAALDTRIKDLSDKATNADETAKASIQTKLQNLRDQRAVLQQKFASVKDATAADWEGVKTNFQSTWEDVKDSFRDAWHAAMAN
jgi:ABC-type uncharacterized transport system auxiliary subunit